MTIREKILAEIAEFCVLHNMRRGDFGTRALGRRDFVRDLEKGVSTLSSLERVEAFMRDFVITQPSLPPDRLSARNQCGQ